MAAACYALDRFFSGEEKRMTDESKEDPRATASDGARAAGTKSDRPKGYTLPKIDFSTFVLSINSSALVQLGLIEDPASGQKIKNLPLAKQTVDLLAMLEEKTRGNLTSDEENILKSILYELRMLYVKEKG
jgi:Domain of unknown function (DUF1844)